MAGPPGERCASRHFIVASAIASHHEVANDAADFRYAASCAECPESPLCRELIGALPLARWTKPWPKAELRLSRKAFGGQGRGLAEERRTPDHDFGRSERGSNFSFRHLKSKPAHSLPPTLAIASRAPRPASAWSTVSSSSLQRSGLSVQAAFWPDDHDSKLGGFVALPVGELAPEDGYCSPRVFLIVFSSSLVASASFFTGIQTSNSPVLAPVCSPETLTPQSIRHGPSAPIRAQYRIDPP